jgi:hypothetical protein
MHCHVFAVLWPIITGSGLDLLAPSFTSSLNHNQYSAIANLPTSQITKPRSILVLVLRCTPMYSSQSHIATDGQSVSKSWCRAPSGAHDQIFISLTVTVLFLWGALSDLRTCLSFVYAAGLCKRSVSRVRVPSCSRPYFTVSDLRLLFSSPPTTRRVTVEIFDPASTRVLT